MYLLAVRIIGETVSRWFVWYGIAIVYRSCDNSTLGLAGGNKQMDGLITSSGSFQGVTDKTQTGEIFSARNKNKENVSVLKNATMCFILKRIF